MFLVYAFLHCASFTTIFYRAKSIKSKQGVEDLEAKLFFFCSIYFYMLSPNPSFIYLLLSIVGTVLSKTYFSSSLGLVYCLVIAAVGFALNRASDGLVVRDTTQYNRHAETKLVFYAIMCIWIRYAYSIFNKELKEAKLALIVDSSEL